MATSLTPRTTADVPPLLLGASTGMTFVDPATVLTRQWFFDGKFLRAEGFRSDQDYGRALVALSNTAVGAGVVHGLEVALRGGGSLGISAGLALTPVGRVAFLPGAVTVSIAELLARTEGSFDPGDRSAGRSGFGPCPPEVAESPVSVAGTVGLYVLTIATADALCGQEERFGGLCEDACDTSSDRSQAVDGVTFRLHPLQLSLPEPTGVPVSFRHLRNRVAAAWFARERTAVGSLISGAGLRNQAWCSGATGLDGEEVPIAVLDRSGSTTTWADQWIARREVMEGPAQRYWQWRMAMRPLDVFLAQVLQFQCQLVDQAVDASPPADGDDGCRETLAEAGQVLDALRGDEVADLVGGSAASSRLDPAVLTGLVSRISAVLAGGTVRGSGSRLIDAGLLSTPSAGYLGVQPDIDIRRQVEEIFGPGVDVRLCIVRADHVPEALKEAQHMDRISLTQGLNDPDRREHVDVLVPAGTTEAGGVRTGRLYAGPMRFGTDINQPGGIAAPVGHNLAGIIRTDPGTAWRITFLATSTKLREDVRLWMWSTVDVATNVFELPAGATTSVVVHRVLMAGNAQGIVGATDDLITARLRLARDPGRDTVVTAVEEGVIVRRQGGNGAVTGPTTQPWPVSSIRWAHEASVPKLAVVDSEGDRELLVGDLAGGRLTFGLGADTASATGGAILTGVDMPEVFIDQLGSGERGRLVDALALIGIERARLGLTDDFAAKAERRLLGRGQTGGTETVVASTDWVMFHRRREITCDDGPVAARPDEPRPPRPPDRVVRRFRVMHADLTPSAFEVSATASLTMADLVARGPKLFDQLVTVAFDAGSVELQSKVELVQAWAGVGGQIRELVGSRILARHDAGEGLQEEQMGAVVDALPVAVPAAADQGVLRRDVDAWLEAADDADGVILLATRLPPDPVEPVDPDRASGLVLIRRVRPVDVDATLAQLGGTAGPLRWAETGFTMQDEQVARFTDDVFGNDEALKQHFSDNPARLIARFNTVDGGLAADQVERLVEEVAALVFDDDPPTRIEPLLHGPRDGVVAVLVVME